MSTVPQLQQLSYVCAVCNGPDGVHSSWCSEFERPRPPGVEPKQRTPLALVLDVLRHSPDVAPRDWCVDDQIALQRCLADEGLAPEAVGATRREDVVTPNRLTNARHVADCALFVVSKWRDRTGVVGKPEFAEIAQQLQQILSDLSGLELDLELARHLLGGAR